MRTSIKLVCLNALLASVMGNNAQVLEGLLPESATVNLGQDTRVIKSQVGKSIAAEKTGEVEDGARRLEVDTDAEYLRLETEKQDLEQRLEELRLEIDAARLAEKELKQQINDLEDEERAALQQLKENEEATNDLRLAENSLPIYFAELELQQLREDLEQAEKQAEEEKQLYKEAEESGEILLLSSNAEEEVSRIEAEYQAAKLQLYELTDPKRAEEYRLKLEIEQLEAEKNAAKDAYEEVEKQVEEEERLAAEAEANGEIVLLSSNSEQELLRLEYEYYAAKLQLYEVTGSRKIEGTRAKVEELEAQLATYEEAENQTIEVTNDVNEGTLTETVAEEVDANLQDTLTGEDETIVLGETEQAETQAVIDTEVVAEEEEVIVLGETEQVETQTEIDTQLEADSLLTNDIIVSEEP